jgi:uncharacterized repeat protein (TIGR03843 family)
MVDLPEARDDLPLSDVLEALRLSPLNLVGQFVWGSNYTFLVTLDHPTGPIPAVYKPAQGERPLWDFPNGTLASREAAAYLCSQALGWDLVPPTVMRSEGPLGAGSVQLFVDADPEKHFFTFSPQDKQRLRPVVTFDWVINNADRKSGHILLSPNHRLWLIDHGVCFHSEDKLRTVVWDFIGESIPPALLDDLARFESALQRETELTHSLAPLLSPDELTALLERVGRLRSQRRFPAPGHERPYPWPLV